MNLSTTYLGLSLSNPLMPGASPLSDDLDTVKRLEDAGASAIVMRSLFEEQIVREQADVWRNRDDRPIPHAAALPHMPPKWAFAMQPDGYLEHLRCVRAAVGVPVIASLNGAGLGAWAAYAPLIEQAGAHALECNLYVVPSDPDERAGVVEERLLESVRAIVRAVSIPIAVKLSPSFTALPNFVKRLAEAGARGVVLFNRLYQPDIDIDALDVDPTVHLSTSSELVLRLRWLARLAGRVPIDIAASGGVHSARDTIKAMAAGADSVQLVSALLRHGPAHLRTVIAGLRAWMEEHDYQSVAELTGSMSLARCPAPSAYERANYMMLLQTFDDDGGSPQGG